MEEYRAAIYVRISKEDGNIESNSIAHQRELIKEFVKNQKDISICSEKTDDGYSGANFQRPGFMEMLEEIKEGAINCVIVKDLSRFGRNYIESGRYIEKIFPFLGVRFIAINDNYDSKNIDTGVSDILIPFKNLINDAYCKDISGKIKSQLNIKRRKGEFIGAFPAYGYKKTNYNRNKLEIDNYPAEVVRDIFRWKIRGLSCKKIADRLNLYGILSPMEYKNYMGFNYKTSFKEYPKAKWSPMAVARILKNDVYIGNIVQGKEANINYRTKKKYKVSKKDWIRVEGVHKSIIPFEIFSLTEKLMKMDIRTSNSNEGFYSGIVKCGNCKVIMMRKSKTYKCKDSNIREEQLNIAILHLFYICLQILGLDQIEETSLRNIRLYKDRKKEELEQYKNRKEEVCEDRKKGIIGEEEYIVFRESYEERIKESKEVLVYLEKMEQNRDIKKTVVNRGIIVFFIENIMVYGKNRIEIKF